MKLKEVLSTIPDDYLIFIEGYMKSWDDPRSVKHLKEELGTKVLDKEIVTIRPGNRQTTIVLQMSEEEEFVAYVDKYINGSASNYCDNKLISDLLIRRLYKLLTVDNGKFKIVRREME